MNQQQLSKNVELEKTLLGKLPEQFRDVFQKKFGENNNSYWQTISVARAVTIFRDIAIPVKGIDVKTVKNKNVDFLAVFGNEKIYTEVKGFVPEDYKIAKNGCIGAGDVEIDRVFKRAQSKFPDSSCNVLVIADEGDLYMNPLVGPRKTLETYLNNPDYAKTSAVMILGGLSYKDQRFKFKICYNANPEKSLPQNVVNIFDRNKSNVY